MDLEPENRWVMIDYTNYRGERKFYEVWPDKFYFGFSDYHPGEQWFMLGIVQNKGYRTFAMKDIHSWEQTQ